jgi:hypothetical protein
MTATLLDTAPAPASALASADAETLMALLFEWRAEYEHYLRTLTSTQRYLHAAQSASATPGERALLFEEVHRLLAAASPDGERHRARAAALAHTLTLPGREPSCS